MQEREDAIEREKEKEKWGGERKRERGGERERERERCSGIDVVMEREENKSVG